MRPEWCPESVWEAATDVSESERVEVVEAVAAAILKERERCANLVRGWNDRKNGHMSEHLCATVSRYITDGDDAR